MHVLVHAAQHDLEEVRAHAHEQLDERENGQHHRARDQPREEGNAPLLVVHAVAAVDEPDDEGGDGEADGERDFAPEARDGDAARTHAHAVRLVRALAHLLEVLVLRREALERRVAEGLALRCCTAGAGFLCADSALQCSSPRRRRDARVSSCLAVWMGALRRDCSSWRTTVSASSPPSSAAAPSPRYLAANELRSFWALPGFSLFFCKRAATAWAGWRLLMVGAQCLRMRCGDAACKR